MIQNEKQLDATRKAIGDLEAAILSLKQDILPKNPARFALMAEPATAQLRKLRQLVDDYIGMTAAVSAEAELWLRLRGPALEFDDAPISVVSAVLRILKTGLQTTTEFLMGEQDRGAHSSSIKEATDLRIVAWEPGSVRVGLRLPETDALKLPGVGEQAHTALDHYMRVACWASSEAEPSDLEAQIPDLRLRRLLLNQVSRLVPRPQGDLDVVEISRTHTDSGTVSLRRDARRRVRAAMKRDVEGQIGDVPATAEGILREIDLDQCTFIIRDPDAQVETKCAIAPEADDLLTIAKQALDHRVIVTGRRRRDPLGRRLYPIQVLEIEELGTVDEESKSR